MTVRVVVNGKAVVAEVEPRLLLVQFVRDVAGLTGTNVGCDTSSCGACTVLLDGTPVKSCTVLAVQADGREVTTVEGVGTAQELHPVQRAFLEAHGLQCGFCTPGMVLVAIDLLQRDPEPDDAAIREAISGNLCRCTGYVNVVEAVRLAATRWGTSA